MIAAGLHMAGARELVDRIRAGWVEEAPHPVTFSAALAEICSSAHRRLLPV